MNVKSILYGLQFRLRQRLLGTYYGIRSPKTGRLAHQPERVLFVLAGLLGDSVMSLPAIMEARRLWPNTRIAVVGKRHNRELLSGCDFFDDFFELNADPLSLSRSAEVQEFENWLSGQHFDAALILLGDQYAHLLAKARIPVRVGVRGTLMKRCLTHTYDIGSPRTWGSNERLNSLRALGCEVKPIDPQLSVKPSSANQAKTKIKAAGVKDKYVVIHPFGSTRRQWWNLASVGELADEIEAIFGIPTVLIGGKEVERAASSIKNDSVINTTGQLRLPELLAVLDQAEFVVSTDSGPFHISCALGKKTIGLFRSRRPEHARSYPKARVILGIHDECARGCEWDRCAFDPCRQMDDISLSQVVELVSLNDKCS